MIFGKAETAASAPGPGPEKKTENGVWSAIGRPLPGDPLPGDPVPESEPGDEGGLAINFRAPGPRLASRTLGLINAAAILGAAVCSAAIPGADAGFTIDEAGAAVSDVASVAAAWVEFAWPLFAFVATESCAAEVCSPREFASAKRAGPGTVCSTAWLVWSVASADPHRVPLIAEELIAEELASLAPFPRLLESVFAHATRDAICPVVGDRACVFSVGTVGSAGTNACGELSTGLLGAMFGKAAPDSTPAAAAKEPDGWTPFTIEASFAWLVVTFAIKPSVVDRLLTLSAVPLDLLNGPTLPAAPSPEEPAGALCAAVPETAGCNPDSTVPASTSGV